MCDASLFIIAAMVYTRILCLDTFQIISEDKITKIFTIFFTTGYETHVANVIFKM